MSDSLTDIDRLELQLADLAAEFRASRGQVSKQSQIAAAYAKVMDSLFAIADWNGQPDVDALLPDEFMPASYQRFWEQATDAPPLSSWDASATDVPLPDVVGVRSKDTTIADIHKTREQISDAFQGNIRAITEDAKRRQAASGRKTVSFAKESRGSDDVSKTKE